VFPPAANDTRSLKNRKGHEVPWASRTPTAFFRGNATGPGTDADTNQRIRLAAMSIEWRRDARLNGGPGGVPFLDAGVVGWNMRDRKLQGKPMTFTRPDELGIPKVPKVPMYEQMQYKYHIYVDGHVAAMRYASMMPLGAVILKVASNSKAGDMWYFPLLRPYDIRAPVPDPAGDHIPVAADLSDLDEVITWCRANDAACERISTNSKALFARLVAMPGQLDYMQLVLVEIARRFHPRATVTPSSAAALAVPAFAAPPGPTADWFGAESAEYAGVGIGGSSAPLPHVPARATATCDCPSCAAITAAAAAAAAAVSAAASSAGSAAGSRGVGALMSALGGGGSGGGGRVAAAAAAAAPAPPRKFQLSSKAAEALAARAVKPA